MSYDYSTPFEESNRYKARLIVSEASIFQCYGVSIKYGWDIRKIDAVFSKVGFAFGVIPFVVHSLL
jgi:hypothetical protein